MRVLMVDAGGFSPPYDYALTDALRSRDVNVTLVEPSGTRALWQDPDAVSDEARARFRSVSRVWKGAKHARGMHALLRQIERERPDIVHFQWLPLPVVDSALIRRLHRRVPLVFTMHNSSLFHGAASSGLQGWKVNEAYAAFDRIIVHSEYGRASALTAGRATSSQLVNIPHGAFSHYAKLVSPESIRRSGPTSLLFAGTIKPYKGLDVLLRALAVAAKATSEPTMRLVVAGSPGMPMGPLTGLATSLGIDSLIEWRLRHQSERELAAAMASADAVVLPYREIDQSGVLLAAVAMNRTVVASRIGGIPEIIKDDVNGLLVPPGDAEALGLALAQVSSSQEFRARSESNMRLLADGPLSWSHAAAQTILLYNSVTAQ